jgi:hypothetical protein
MGLLDDAIRDHLELKRRRGADPSEIAREEREALEPVFPDEPRPPGFDDEPQAAAVLDEEPPHGDPLEEAAAHAEAHDAGTAGTDPFAGQPLGEETAELDMQAVLEEEVPALEDAAPSATELDEPVRAARAETAEPVRAEPAADVARSEDLRPPPQGEEDLMEWEVPGRVDDEPPPQPLPGQESMSFE